MTCHKCGQILADGDTFCSFCGEPVKSAPQPNQGNTQSDYYNQGNTQPDYYNQPAPEQPPVESKPENVVGGIIGALIGALIGGASIVLLSQLGFVASISGLILAFCSLKGYELMAGKLSTKGIIICIIFILVTPYFADRLDTAILTMRELPMYSSDLIGAFNAYPRLIELGIIDQEVITTNLVMLYGFTALGAFGTIWNAFKKKK